MKESIKLLVTPVRPAVLADHRSTVDVLVRLQAPVQPQPDRAVRSPLHLALVIDRSGSMSGQPIEEAVRCAGMVVNRLSGVDRAAIVTYDHAVHRLTDLLGVDRRSELHGGLAAISVRGRTNLHGGWLEGAGVLAPHTRTDVLSRVILLSDGQANVGLTDTDRITTQVAELADAGVTTSTYGLGRRFNEDLMTAIADAGRGNAYYGETADDLADPFSEELALLDALCARDIELVLETPPGVQAEVLNGCQPGRRGGWALPDLAYSGDAWALVRLTVEAARPGDQQELLSARMLWRTLDGVQCMETADPLVLPVMGEVAYSAVAEDGAGRRRLNEIRVSRLKETARDEARRQDWDAVARTIEQARGIAGDDDSMVFALDAIERMALERNDVLFSKEARYSARRDRSRLAPRDEWDMTASVDRPLYLRRKSAQGRREPPAGDS